MHEASMPTIAILCGGMATRLGKRTAAVPKSLLPVSSKPFLEHQLALLVCSGFRDVVLLCGHLAKPIRDFAGDGRDFGCRIRYSEDGPTLLGTGGAVKKALCLLGEHFFLLYGDSYCRTDYGEIDRAFRGSRKLGLMTVFRNRNAFDRSNVEFYNGSILRYDKGAMDESFEHIDYGVSVFRAEAFADQPEAFDLAWLQAELLRRDELAGYEVAERFYEIGSVDGIESTSAFLSKGEKSAKER